MGRDNVIYGYDTTLHAVILHKMVSIDRSQNDTFFITQLDTTSHAPMSHGMMQ